MRSSLLLLVVGCVASGHLYADAANVYRDAQRIVVVMDNEGVHYAHGCAFYELRDLIAENVDNAAITADAAAPRNYEIRVLGKFGEKTVYVGDHQIMTAERTVAVPDAAFARIVKLIEKRRGQGVASAFVEASVKQALARIQDPAYVEENRCSRD